MQDRKKNALRRLIISEMDLREARRFAAYMLDHKLLPARSYAEQTIRLAFQTALLVAYARPFKPGGKRKQSLVPPRLGGRHLRGLSGSEKKLHERLLNMRSREYAHSDADAYGVQFAEGEIQELEISFMIPISRNPHAPLEEHDVTAVVNLIDKFLGSIIEKRAELEEELFPKPST